jgi:hypothetical protein
VSKPERQAAEGTLRQMKSSPGFGMVCLRFVTLDGVPSALKQSACVTFKNLVKDHWSSLSDADKLQIKQSILPLLLSGPPAALRSLLSASVALIAQSDFPAQWPNLVSDLVGKANPNDYGSLVGVLRTAHSVFRRYRNVSTSTEVLKVTSQRIYIFVFFFYFVFFQKKGVEVHSGAVSASASFDLCADVAAFDDSSCSRCGAHGRAA